MNIELLLDQEQNIRRWNEGKISFGLIHPVSAGHGLNFWSGGNIPVGYFDMETLAVKTAEIYVEG